MLQVFYEFTPNVYSEAQTVRRKAFEVGTACRSGEAYSGKIPFDDPTGVLTIKGWRKVRVYETTASPTLLWSGRIHNKAVKRGDSERASLRTGAARWWDCDAVDQNTLLGSRLIRGDGGKRPAESAGERLTWLLGTSFTILVDNGHVTYPSNRLDAADYTLQTAADVIADCAQPGGYNFFALQVDDTGFPELFFQKPEITDDWVSTLSISDDLDDIDLVTVFPPDSQAYLDIIDEQVASGVAVPFNPTDASDTGYVYVTDSAIGDEFAFVDKAAPMANVKTAAKATTIADRHLVASSTEAERITCTVHLPAALANAIRPWHRIAYKSTWMPNFSEYRSCRVTDWSIEQQGYSDGRDGYLVHLQLSPITDTPDPEPMETFTLVATNSVVETTERAGSDFTAANAVSFAIGQVWRWTITNTQHDPLALDDSFALYYAATTPPGANTPVRLWGTTIFGAGDYPTAPPAQTGGPPFGPFADDTGTFVVGTTALGKFTIVGSANYAPGTPAVDEQWTCVLERLS